jgi:hypothetical protein
MAETSMGGRSRVPNALKNGRSSNIGAEALGSSAAALNGAFDSLPFGAANTTYAFGRAVGDTIGGKPYLEAWADRIGNEERRDRYEAERYPIARTIGEVAGLGGQYVAAGPLEGAILGGSRLAGTARLVSKERRIAQVTPRIWRETAALAASGAAAGGGAQAVNDVASGRLSNWRDYLASAGGGATTAALATRGVPTRLAGAAGGAATS